MSGCDILFGCWGFIGLVFFFFLATRYLIFCFPFFLPDWKEKPKFLVNIFVLIIIYYYVKRSGNVPTL